MNNDARGYDVFISYSHADRKVADELFDALSARHPQWHVFLDRNAVDDGDDFTSLYHEAIEQAQAFLYVLSANYVGSSRCQQEWKLALHCEGQGKLKKFGVLAAPGDYKGRYTQHQYEKVRGGRLSQAALNRLVPKIAKAVVLPEPQLPPQIWALVNFKGGVGKTTLTVALAECLASQQKDGHRKVGKPAKVLVVDADHQANATMLLLGYGRAGSLVRIDGQDRVTRDETLAAIALQALSGNCAPDFAQYTITGNTSRVLEARPNLDLLPAGPTLFDFDIRLGQAARGKPIGDRAREFARAFREFVLVSGYEFVLVDIGAQVNRAAWLLLLASDHIAVPVSPDLMAVSGATYLLTQLKPTGTIACAAKPLMLILNRHPATPTKGQRDAKKRAGKLAYDAGLKLETVPQLSELGNASEDATRTYKTLAGKYGKAAGIVRQLAVRLRTAGAAAQQDAEPVVRAMRTRAR